MNQRSVSIYALAGAAILMGTSYEANSETRNWIFEYNSNGQVTLADGPRTDVDDYNTYAYDNKGNRISATNALGHVTRMTSHNNRGQPGRITDPDGVEIRINYHPRGWLLSRTVVSPTGDSAANATTYYSYDDEGQLLSTQLPDGSLQYNEYDSAHRLVAISNGLGERIDFTLDAAGNRVTENTWNASSAMLRSITKNHDELNRLIQITGGAGQVTSFSYDRNGNQSSETDGNGNTTVHSNDAHNRKSGSSAAYSHNISYAHDERGNLINVIDPRGLETRYTYNAFDEILTTASPDTGFSYFNHDPAGNRISRSDANGVTASLTYDALNRPITATYPDSNVDVAYGYDSGSFGKGRLTSRVDSSGTTSLGYDHRGNLTYQGLDTGTLQIDVSYQYDLADKLTHITYPSGRTVIYHYDSIGRPSGVETTGTEGSRTVASNLEYLSYGPVSALTYGNGIQMNASFDLSYRLTSLAHGSARSANYAYDAADNILSINDNYNSAFSQTLAYDALNRLGAASGNYGNLSYRYDANGNRLSYTSSAGTDDYTYDSISNRLQSTDQWDYQYDSNGNLIEKINRNSPDGDAYLYQYDSRNRLTQVSRRNTSGGQQIDTVLANYAYNALGQRARKNSESAARYYIYNRAGKLLAEMNEEGIALREYIYFNNKPIAVAQANLTQQPSEVGPETIIDDTSPATSSNGTWNQVRKKGAYGDYYHRSENAGGAYRWNLRDINTTEYEVYAWWPKTKKNNKAAQYRISHNGRSSLSIQNQSAGGKKWAYLGTYDFSGDGNDYIELADDGGKTAADGIRLVEILPPPPPVISIELYYIHPDHLGTPQALTDQSQNVVWNANYKPFGDAQVNVASITSNLRFPGQYYDDESGLHQNYFRDYDPELGRYIQSDPIGLSGGVNTYSYASQNPIGYYDPDGLEVFVHSRPVRGLGPAGSHTFTTITLTSGEATTVSSHSKNGYNVISINHPSDTSAGAKTTDSVLVPVPEGMTSTQFDYAVLNQAKIMLNQPPLKYKLFPNVYGNFPEPQSEGNCHTTTSNLIRGAGGLVPISYNPRGFNPGLH
ncbi:MAG: RHS repeat-associated core domain-containing protein [Halioglobus sp.]